MRSKHTLHVVCLVLIYHCIHEVRSLSTTGILQLDGNNHSRIVRQTKCSKGQFECANGGQCIPFGDLCDGKANCRDKSDETAACKEIQCANYAFKCDYGACVDGDAACNNVQDCEDNSDEKGCNSVNPVAERPVCRNSQDFQCNDGECIRPHFLCDGVYNCQDGSDESAEKCSNTPCPSYLYKCNYGACVDGDARCNQVQNCADGSDEKDCEARPTPPPIVTRPPTSRPTTRTTTTRTTTRRPPTIFTTITTTTPRTTTTSGGCTLPDYPSQGEYTVAGNSPNLRPGSMVSIGTQITYYCRKEHTLLPENLKSQYCIGSIWIPEGRPECVATCPPLVSKSVEVTCKLGEVTQDCTKPVLPRTRASLSCKPLFEYPSDKTPRFAAIRCWDGSWDYPISDFRCVPVCGKKRIATGVGSPLIFFGEDASRGEYPWQIAIYQKTVRGIQFICGGSVVNEKVILSAAHCFTNATNGAKFPAENYIAAAGKFYSQLGHQNDIKDGAEQRSEIETLHIRREYRGRQRSYADDIAIAVLKIALTYTEFVQPVCIDWLNVLTDREMAKKEGVVTGWGITSENGQVAATLKVLKVPFVPFIQCLDNVPDDFKPYLTNEKEKMCAGYLNGSSVCNGDSGGPLTFEFSSRYYIKGIVSLAPGKGTTCDPQQYGTYTKINEYIDWIQQIEIDNRV